MNPKVKRNISKMARGNRNGSQNEPDSLVEPQDGCKWPPEGQKNTTKEATDVPKRRPEAPERRRKAPKRDPKERQRVKVSPQTKKRTHKNTHKLRTCVSRFKIARCTNTREFLGESRVRIQETQHKQQRISNK